VRQALSLNNATLEEARRSVLDLRAAPLEGRPLPEALKALVEDWRDAEGIAAEFESLNAGRPLSSRVEVALYRICQEALANVARHARASRVSTRLVMTPEWARLTVEDDGQGFNAGQSPKGHYGLVGMNERARMLGGTLDVRTGTGPGTRIEATVPLLEDL
jgi:two-component system NarL family sensor kinase